MLQTMLEKNAPNAKETAIEQLNSLNLDEETLKKAKEDPYLPAKLQIVQMTDFMQNSGNTAKTEELLTKHYRGASSHPLKMPTEDLLQDSMFDEIKTMLSNPDEMQKLLKDTLGEDAKNDPTLNTMMKDFSSLIKAPKDETNKTKQYAVIESFRTHKEDKPFNSFTPLEWKEFHTHMSKQRNKGSLDPIPPLSENKLNSVYKTLPSPLNETMKQDQNNQAIIQDTHVCFAIDYPHSTHQQKELLEKARPLNQQDLPHDERNSILTEIAPLRKALNQVKQERIDALVKYYGSV